MVYNSISVKTLFNSEKNYYPEIDASRPKEPNYLWAVPFFGGLAKGIILIPVFIELAILALLVLFATIVNSFSVFFTGKYLDFAFDMAVGVMRLSLKVMFYFQGIVDTYPSFDLGNSKGVVLNISKPKNPNKLWAIPFFGFLAKVIILIPYFFWEGVVRSGANVAVVVSSLSVFFRRYYPESTYEIVKDSARINAASLVFLLGISDTYPSFKISWNHKKIKIALIILGVLFTLGNYSDSRDMDDDKGRQRFEREFEKKFNEKFDKNLYKDYKDSVKTD